MAREKDGRYFTQRIYHATLSVPAGNNQHEQGLTRYAEVPLDDGEVIGCADGGIEEWLCAERFEGVATLLKSGAVH